MSSWDQGPSTAKVSAVTTKTWLIVSVGLGITILTLCAFILPATIIAITKPGQTGAATTTAVAAAAGPTCDTCMVTYNTVGSGTATCTDACNTDNGFVGGGGVYYFSLAASYDSCVGTVTTGDTTTCYYSSNSGSGGYSSTDFYSGGYTTYLAACTGNPGYYCCCQQITGY